MLSYIETNIIKEKVIKTAAKAEAQRVYNYPLAAVEEVVANAFYHRSYERQNGIEINCFDDRIEVLSFPGPLPPVTKTTLKLRRIVARNYRNRRVGDFLKELKLTEGRSTGFPTIYDSLEANGSPNPVFETDEDFNYFLAVLAAHEAFLPVENRLTTTEQTVLTFCLEPQTRAAIMQAIGLSNQKKNFEKYIAPLLQKGWLQYTFPEMPKSPKQQYVTSEEGKQRLNSGLSYGPVTKRN